MASLAAARAFWNADFLSNPRKSILYELSSTTTAVTFACPSTSVPEVFNAGRANAKANSASNAQRSKSKSKSSSCIRRWFCSTLSLMNFIAAQVTFLNFRRFSR